MSLPHLFVLGDSISMQYGPHLQVMLEGVMTYARKTGENEGEGYADLDMPEGANGGDSQRVLQYLRFKAEHEDFHPDVLLVNCGLHDIKTDPETSAVQVELDAYRGNLAEIVKIGRQTAGTLVWVRTTPVDDEQHNTRAKAFKRFAKDLLAYNAVADEIMTSAGVASIDLFAFTNGLGPPAEVFCDHVHYPEPVQRLQAAFIAGYLRRLLTEK
jgi:hypothetical protein